MTVWHLQHHHAGDDMLEVPLHWWTDEPRIRVVYEDLLVYEARMDFTSLVRPRNDIRGS